MDTTTLNINPTSDEKSEKTEKVKQAAAKAAQFAGTAGLGVAGTMAVNTMNTHEEDNTGEIISHPQVTPVTPTAETSESGVVEAVSDFDPNDIMIEATEVETDDDNKIETVETTIETSAGDVALVEPQPITGVVDVEHTTEVLIAEVDPHVYEEMYGGPGDWDDFDHDDLLGEEDTLLADSEDVNDDLDIADDILA